MDTLLDQPEHFTETAQGSDHYGALFTIGIFLFIVTFFINLSADLIVRGIRKE